MWPLSPAWCAGGYQDHAHHIRFAQPRAMGRKVSDEWTVPLCATHHQSLHTVGGAEGWWKARRIGPIAKAGRLWQQSRDGKIVKLDTAQSLIMPGPGLAGAGRKALIAGLRDDARLGFHRDHVVQQCGRDNIDWPTRSAFADNVSVLHTPRCGQVG